MRGLALAAPLALALAGCGAPAAEQLPRARIVSGWPQLPAGVTLGQVSAVDVDGRGRVYVLQRGTRVWAEPFPGTPIAEPAVYVFEGASGRLLTRWGAGQFVMPHGLSIDPAGKVWITDAAREQVYRFSSDGRRELAIGTAGVTGADGAHFGRPTDVAFDGARVLVADGYLNSRVAVFDRGGRFLGQFGRMGPGDGPLRVPHSIALDAGSILVADRENSRIARFAGDGRPLAAWRRKGGGRPYAVKPLPDGGAVSVEGRDGADRGGVVLRVWARDGTLVRSLDASARAGPSKGHDLAVAPAGQVYVADVDAGRVVKIDLSGQGH